MYVRTQNDMGQWIKFFLNAISQTAEKGVDTFNEILQLKTEVHEKIIKLGRKGKNAQKLINYLYRKPLININEVRQLLNISKPAALHLVSNFERLGLLYETTGNQRYRIYFFKRYYELFLK